MSLLLRFKRQQTLEVLKEIKTCGLPDAYDIYVLNQDGILAQLVRNAIDNAIRYTPANGQVDVSLSLMNNLAVLRVEDTGTGIASEDLTQVFQPFYRSQDNTQNGNGLGLAISKEIAQRLGGEIQLQNRPEGGLIFTYSQPNHKKE
jgi:two-component system, OmpR family, sensor kinase